MGSLFCRHEGQQTTRIPGFGEAAIDSICDQIGETRTYIQSLPHRGRLVDIDTLLAGAEAEARRLTIDLTVQQFADPLIDEIDTWRTAPMQGPIYRDHKNDREDDGNDLEPDVLTIPTSRKKASAGTASSITGRGDVAGGSN